MQEKAIIMGAAGRDFHNFKPDIHIVVFDPHRPGHETGYHPGETNLIMADVAVINKVDSAVPENVEKVRKSIEANNPRAEIVLADSELTAEDAEQIRGKKVLVVEDGPTLTHGEMAYGAGVIAARRFGAAQLMDPRSHLAGSIIETFQAYPGIVLRAIGIPRDMFKVMCAIGRLPGWFAQWKESREDPNWKLCRPRQIYKGPYHA